MAKLIVELLLTVIVASFATVWPFAIIAGTLILAVVVDQVVHKRRRRAARAKEKADPTAITIDLSRRS